MTIQQTYHFFQNKQKLIVAFITCVTTMIIINVFIDYLFTLFQKSSFYISESLLFSSYWALYFPLLLLFSKVTKRTEKFELKFILSFAFIVVHLFAYPALVWFISKIFYSHTFAYWQTFNFGLSAYFIKTVLLYGFSLGLYTLVNEKNKTLQISQQDAVKTDRKVFISSILVSCNNNKKILLEVNDILYFSANSPYITIYHLLKKYLHTETLKSLESRLNDKQFVRIHKSHIVNINKILSIQSRQNGDYDISLSDGTILRVSRNYAKDFKGKFEQYTHLRVK